VIRVAEICNNQEAVTKSHAYRGYTSRRTRGREGQWLRSGSGTSTAKKNWATKQKPTPRAAMHLRGQDSHAFIKIAQATDCTCREVAARLAIVSGRRSAPRRGTIALFVAVLHELYGVHCNRKQNAFG
jgi:hypothetical protein